MSNEGHASGAAPEYLLYCFAQSGNAYKAALMLETVGAQRGRQLWQPRFVDYFNGETRTPEYRAINVMGEVPVLEFGGQRLSQSGVILETLASRLDAYGAASEAERAEVLRWLLFDNHKFTSYTATYRFLRAFATAPDPTVVQFFRTRCEARGACWTRNWPDTASWLAIAPPSPTSRWRAMCSSMTRSVCTGARSIRIFTRGRSACARCRAGSTLMS